MPSHRMPWETAARSTSVASHRSPSRATPSSVSTESTTRPEASTRRRRNRDVPQSQLKTGPIISTQIRFHLDQDDLDAAAQLVQRYEIGAQEAFNLNTMGEQVVVARLRIKQGRWDQAAHRLERLRAFAQTSNLTGLLIEILRLQARAAYGQTQPAQALASLL